MVARRLLAGNLSLDVEYDLRTGVYRHLLTLEQHYHDDHQTGQLLSRATADVTAIRVFLGYGLIFITQYVALVAAVIALLIWTSPPLALASFVLAPHHDLAVGALLAALVPGPARRAAARRRRDDAGRGGDRRRPRDQGVRAGGSRGRPLRAALARPSSTARSTRPACRPPTSRCSTSCRSSASRSCSSPAASPWRTGRSRSAASSSSTCTSAMLVMPLRMVGMWVGQVQRAVASGSRVFELLDTEATLETPAQPMPLPHGWRRAAARGRALRLRPRAPDPARGRSRRSRKAARWR